VSAVSPDDIANGVQLMRLELVSARARVAELEDALRRERAAPRRFRVRREIALRVIDVLHRWVSDGC